MNYLFVFLLPFIFSCEKVIAEYSISVRDEALQQKYLKEHNKLRYAEKIQPLKWDISLEKHAKSWVNHLSDICKISDSRGSGYGEAIDQSWQMRHDSPRLVVKRWSKYVDHILSPETRLIGCGFAYCEDPFRYGRSRLIVCNYFP